MYRQRKFAVLFVFLLPAFIIIPAQESFLKATSDAQLLLSERGEVVIRFVKPQDISLSDLSAFISIDRHTKDTLTAYVNEAGFNRFLQLKIPFEVLNPPSLRQVNPLKNFKTTQTDLRYPSYPEYLQMMEDFALAYPELCVLQEIGKTVKNRSLLAIKISDNPGEKENEPVVFYSAAMHGDEAPGYVLMLKLIDYLLSSYTSNSEIKELVDNVEIWINPLTNPDGTYFLSDSSPEGATRFNANQTDLNRDFPNVTQSSDSRAKEKETLAMMDFLEKIGPDLSANFHSGAEVVNYPWDSWVNLHPDDQWYRFISRTFADTAHKFSEEDYMTDLDNGITNGYAWYKVTGSRQDYTNYFLFSREVTIELSEEKFPDENQLGLLWDYTHRSLVQYIGHSLTGIDGSVTDSLTGKPLKAQVSIVDHDNEAAHSFVYADIKDGKFYRLLNEGNYSLRISAPGYIYKNVLAQVNAGELTPLSVRLLKETLHPNPFGDYLYFTVPNAGEELRITFTDAAGRMVQTLTHPVLYPGRQEIATGNLPSGFYIISLSYNGQSWIHKGIRTNQHH
jgi:hypothetical protein